MCLLNWRRWDVIQRDQQHLKTALIFFENVLNVDFALFQYTDVNIF